MDNYLNTRLNELENRLGPNKSREQQLEEEVKILRQQLVAQANIDPTLAEFRNSSEYVNAKKDRFLLWLYYQHCPIWEQSQLGQEFLEWEKQAFEEFKKRKVKAPPPLQTQPQYYNQGGMNNG